MNTQRVEYDRLIYDDEHIFIFDGWPFSGVGFEEFEDGTTRSEVYFLNGREHGLARDYFASGVCKSETPYRNGGAHGVGKEWHEDGTLKKQMLCEYGVLIESTSYSQGGDLIEKYKRDEKDEMMQRVVERRKADTPQNHIE